MILIRKVLRKIYWKMFPKRTKIVKIPPEDFVVPETCSIPLSCIIKFSSKLKLGQYVAFNDFVFINASGGIEIGDYTAIGPFTMIHSANHNYKKKNTLIQKQGHTFESTKIGKDVLISAHVTILCGSDIPEGCIIGAKTLITRNTKMEKYGVYVGNPARKIGMRE